MQSSRFSWSKSRLCRCVQLLYGVVLAVRGEGGCAGEVRSKCAASPDPSSIFEPFPLTFSILCAGCNRGRTSHLRAQTGARQRLELGQPYFAEKGFCEPWVVRAQQGGCQGRGCHGDTISGAAETDDCAHVPKRGQHGGPICGPNSGALAVRCACRQMFLCAHARAASLPRASRALTDRKKNCVIGADADGHRENISNCDDRLRESSS